MISLLSYGHATALVQTENCRLVVDPWLTSRLDRFWVRAIDIPPGLAESLGDGLDAIMLTHHHVDHLHYPSLRLLGELLGRHRRAEIPVYYPRPAARRYGGAGMGHLPVEMSLAMLGYQSMHALRAEETTSVNGLEIKPFPSRVPFPELSYLFTDGEDRLMICQDAVLHPRTWEVFTGPRAPRPHVVLLPSHSYVPPNVLTERRLLASYDEAVETSLVNFDRYVSTMNGQLTVPFACGWKVAALETDFSWINSAMYPLTPGQGRARLTSQGRQTTSAPPGRRISVKHGEITIGFEGTASDADVDQADHAIMLDPDAPIPAFSPEADRVGKQTVPTRELADTFAHEFVGTEAWWDQVGRWAPVRLNICDDSGLSCFSVTPDGSARPLDEAEPVSAGAIADGAQHMRGVIEIAGSTLESLLSSRLLYGSAWGLWVGDPAVLASVFHHPKWYARHLARVLAAEPRPYITDE